MNATTTDTDAHATEPNATEPTCPDEGTLRAFLDHEAPDHAALTRHVRSCLPCAAQVRDLRIRAAESAGLLDSLAATETAVTSAADGNPGATPKGTPADGTTGGGPDKASSGVPLGGPHLAPHQLAPIEPPTRRRIGAGWAAAAALVLAVSGVLVTPTGRSVASSVLGAFRSRAVVGVTLTDADANSALSALSELGTVPDAAMSPIDPKGVDSIAVAQRKVPFTIAAPTADQLPADLANVTPRVALSAGKTAAITFSESKTRAYLKLNESTLAIPAGYADTRLLVTYPTSVALDYSKGDHTLMIGTAGPVAVSTKGPLSLEELRTFILEVPGMPSSLTDQLSNVDTLQGNLPIPIPTDIVQGTETTVGNHKAVEMSISKMGSGVIWHEGDRIVGVAGTYDSDEIRGTAERLAK